MLKNSHKMADRSRAQLLAVLEEAASKHWEAMREHKELIARIRPGSTDPQIGTELDSLVAAAHAAYEEWCSAMREIGKLLPEANRSPTH